MNHSSLAPIDINFKFSIQDFAIVKMNYEEGYLDIYPSRSYIGYETGDPAFDEFIDALQVLENLQGLGSGDGTDGGRFLPAVLIDIRKYYPACGINVIAVESVFDRKKMLIGIDEEKHKMLYYLNPTDVWEDSEQSDSFWYTVRNENTGEIATAKVNLTRVDIFLPYDIYVELNPLYTGVIKIDFRRFYRNVEESAGQIVSIGPYNRELIRSVTQDPGDPYSLKVVLATTCDCWDCDWTDFELFIKGTLPETGETLESKVYVNLIKPCDNFLANLIEIDIEGSVPEYIDIDISVYNSHALIQLLQIGNVADDRGEIVYSTSSNKARYVFNRDSGYWNDSPVQDMFMYNIRNKANGLKAKSYILIRRKASSSSSSGPVLHFSTDYPIIAGTALYKAA